MSSRRFQQYTRHVLMILVSGLLVFGAMPWGVVHAQQKGAKNARVLQQQQQTTITDAAGRKHTRMRKVTPAERKAAAQRLKDKRAAAAPAAPSAAVEAPAATMATPLAAPLAAAAAVAVPVPTGVLAPNAYLVGPNGQLIPDVSGMVPNYANSPAPFGVIVGATDPLRNGEPCSTAMSLTWPEGATCGGPYTGGIRKFVDSLPDLNTPNNLGQQIPVAVAEEWCSRPEAPTTGCVSADYYEIQLGQYQEKMHTDLPPTTLRGYRQTNITPIPAFHYLGPLIIAQKGKPVRVKFTNALPTGGGGNLLIPVDTTVMGAGAGPNVDDGTRMTTAGQQCVGVDCYTQNRATIHLHGGVTPWISDGTTHQWITPAGESTSYPKGVSVYNVPDMPNPGKTAVQGSQTFYYTNDQSARLMFYHDHAHGITRLNVYVGEAAGYLITDPVEQDLVTRGIIPALQIPLIIQDKTFVDPNMIGYQDPTWNWGTGATTTHIDSTGKSAQLRAPIAGDLWWPHVYQPAQNPYDITGTNAMGRWVYGMWFWPPTNNIPFKEAPNPYYDCDQFGNPAAGYPCTRPWQPPTVPGTPNPSITAEAFLDTPVINGTAYPYLDVPAGPVRFRILNAAHDRFWNLSLYEAKSSTLPMWNADGTLANEDAGEVALNAAEVSAAKTDPTVFPTPNTSQSKPGPSWIYIGTEGGFLPMPVVVPPQVTTWVTDPTVFNAGNVDKHSLLLGPAERADVIVDFTGKSGTTYILYNDAPAAFPARDPRFDYYTDAADLTDTGGVAPPLPGYGPNTRTIMQIRVKDPNGTGPFNLADLTAAFTPNPGAGTKGVFQDGQDPIVVGQSAYDTAYGTQFPSRFPCWGIAQIGDTSMCVTTANGDQLQVPLQPKAIHDEMGASFDDYGRMSTNLGLELPNTQIGNQNFILQSYSDPPTELVKLSDYGTAIGGAFADGTQLWKITHNGVDTHPIHFHLFHVQLINRVGWDNGKRLPHPTELGWKDTVRISPLEDTIVALRPISPRPEILPWKLPNSVRPLEPALPIGSQLGFTNIDPLGNAVTVTNEYSNFGWEYIWHCHILSHEEHDMMRAVGFAMPPEVPTHLTATPNGNGVVVNWTDNSLVETSFTVERAPDGTTFTKVGVVAPDVTTFNDLTVTPGKYTYRVFASNTIGSTVPGYPTLTADSKPSDPVIATFTPAPKLSVNPTALVFGDQVVGTNSAVQTLTVANVSGAAVTVNSAAFSLADFYRPGGNLGTCGNFPRNLNAGASCTINVRFTPAAIGPRTGQLVVTAAADPAGPYTVALSGNGTGPVAAVSPTALTFSTALNVPSAPQTVTVTNSGTAPLTINSVTRNGGNANQFAHVSSCPASLPAGASCTISVTFAPTAATPLTKTTTLRVNVAAPATMQQVSLTGTIGVPTFTVAPSPVAFGNQSVAGGVKQVTVTVTNTSTVPLRIISINRSGGQATQFPQIINVNCPISPATLPGNTSCQVTAGFNPTSAGLKTTNLNVNVGAPGTSQSVPMSGTGILP